MNRLAVYHKSKSNFAYAVSENKLHIRLKTASGDFDKVYIAYGEKYAWHHKNEKLMECILIDCEYDYFQTEIIGKSKRFTYYFKLVKNQKTYFYTESGLLDDCEESTFSEYYFQFPYINKKDLHVVPDWIYNAACYQIFPDRFKNGNPKLNPPNVEKWGCKPTTENFMGGDLPGITEKLDYLKKLGINTVYMTPFFKSNSNHKYDIIDYMEIDPCFGTKEDFRKLVEKAHAMGMKVFLDAVFNHSATDFFAFKDVLENGKNSIYKDWFFIKKFPIEINEIFTATRENQCADWYMVNGEDILSYECFGYYPSMPKLNTGNDEVRKYFIDVGKYWIDKFDIDGWRLDVSNEIDHSFWREFRSEIKAVKNDILIIGEIWDNGEPWLRGDQFDGVMNYGLTQAIKDYIANGFINKDKFILRINRVLMRNTDTANDAMLNLLDSHDTERLFTTLKENEDKLIMCLGIVYTFIGIPMIYYGTEIGMTGKNDPDCRKCMIWNEKKWNKKIFNSVKKLIKLRKTEKALQSGTFRWVHLNKNLVSYIRTYEESSVLVVINNTDTSCSFILPEDYKNAIDIFNKTKSSVIEKYGFKIIKK